MNKLELIQSLKDTAKLSKSEATAVVDIFFNEMTNALANGNRVEIRGLCSFFRQGIWCLHWAESENRREGENQTEEVAIFSRRARN